MKAQELRIGNWINLYDKHNSQVTGFTEDGDVWFVKNPKHSQCAWNISSLKPIPLTEEWLVKFGFEYLADAQYILEINSIEFNWDKETGLYIFNDDSEFGFELEHIKHVHQLQNLYYALTSKELTYETI